MNVFDRQCKHLKRYQKFNEPKYENCFTILPITLLIFITKRLFLSKVYHSIAHIIKTSISLTHSQLAIIPPIEFDYPNLNDGFKPCLAIRG